MSIESAKFIIQRGAQQFKCRGDELKDKLEEGDLMVVQHDNENQASKWRAEAPDLCADYVDPYRFKQLTTDTATYLRPHLYEGRLLVTKEGQPEIFEMHQDGTVTTFTDIAFKPEWNVHFVLEADSQTVVCFESPAYPDATIINGTSDDGASWSYDQYTWANFGVPEAMYAYGSKIAAIQGNTTYLTGTYLGTWQEKSSPYEYHEFDPDTGSMILVRDIFAAGQNIKIYPGLSSNGFNPSVTSGGQVFSWAPINSQVVQVDTNKRITYPTNWADKNQTGTVTSIDDYIFDNNPCSDWTPLLGSRRAHVIDEDSVITGYEADYNHFTISKYAADGSLELTDINASEIGEVIRMFNIWGGVYAVTPAGLAVLEVN